MSLRDRSTEKKRDRTRRRAAASGVRVGTGSEEEPLSEPARRCAGLETDGTPVHPAPTHRFVPSPTWLLTSGRESMNRAIRGSL